MKNKQPQATLDASLIYKKLWLAAKVIESTMEGIFVTDTEGDLQIVNPAFTSLTGFTPEETIGRAPDFLHSPLQPTLDGNFWERLREDERWQGKLWLRHADGHSFLSWVSVDSIYAEEDEQAGPRRVVLFNDISTTEKIEQEQAFIAEVTSLANSSPDDPSLLQRIATLAISRRLAGCCLVYLKSTAGDIYPAATAISPHRTSVPASSIHLREVIANGEELQLEEEGRRTICLPIRSAVGIAGCLTLLTEPNDHVPYPANLEAARELANALGRLVDAGSMNRLVEQFRTGLDATFDSIIIINADTYCFNYVNQAAARMLNYTQGELVTMCLPDFRPDFNAKLFSEAMAPLLSGERPSLSFETEFQPKEGQSLLIEISLRYIASAIGGAGQYLAILRDISERRRIENEIQEIALYDPLTKLPNRSQLITQLQQRIEQASQEGEILALLYIDLDRFKTINDTLGHVAGDRLLAQVGERLSAYAQQGDLIARLGGDEFALILSPVSELEEVSQAAEAILANLQTSFQIEGRELHITPSIGIGLYPQDGQDAQTLLQHSEVALYRAKHRGRNTYRYYTASLNAMALERLVLENSLRHALEREEFSVHYQPQVSLRSGRILGAEALVRWNHPDLGTISPSDFVPLAEETGIMGSIDNWTLLHACREAAAWPESIHVSVNISNQQIQEPDFSLLVTSVLRESGLPPSRLELEMTEGIIIENPELVIKTLNEIKALGVHLAIDDFGTGYSSLSHLKRMPLDILKIDQTFVRDCLTSDDDSAIITAIISMSHSLSLDVVAEGVETKEQLEFLMSLSCDTVQGYLFSPPLPAAKFNRLIKEQPFQEELVPDTVNPD